MLCELLKKEGNDALRRLLTTNVVGPASRNQKKEGPKRRGCLVPRITIFCPQMIRKNEKGAGQIVVLTQQKSALESRNTFDTVHTPSE